MKANRYFVEIRLVEVRWPDRGGPFFRDLSKTTFGTDDNIQTATRRYEWARKSASAVQKGRRRS